MIGDFAGKRQGWAGGGSGGGGSMAETIRIAQAMLCPGFAGLLDDAVMECLQ
jgi:hypothetical protein